jgi:SRSO17 transposase
MGALVLIRRDIEKPEERAYYLVFAPRETTLEERVRVAGTRWRIESCFEEAKGDCGLDEYECRKWEAWYRHVTLSMRRMRF